MRTENQMNRFVFVCDKLKVDLPSEFISGTFKAIKIKHCQVLPKLEDDEYILHSNIVQGAIDTGTETTQQFVCFCNTPYLINKHFVLTKSIRSMLFSFSTLKKQEVNEEELQFLIELEMYTE